MAKPKKIKWSVGADEPEDLQEFLSNDEIVAKHRDKKTEDIDWPSKGPHTFVVRRVTVKPNRNGDDRVAVMQVIQNGKGEDQSWNGYLIFDGFNITEQGKPFLKRWLASLGLKWTDFYTNSLGETDKNSGVTTMSRIGKVKFDGTKEVTNRATVTIKPPDDFNDDDHLEIRRYISVLDDSSTTDEDSSGDESVETFGGDGPTREEQESLITEELKGMKIPALTKRALRNDKKSEPPTKKKDLIAHILEQELPPF